MNVENDNITMEFIRMASVIKTTEKTYIFNFKMPAMKIQLYWHQTKKKK